MRTGGRCSGDDIASGSGCRLSFERCFWFSEGAMLNGFRTERASGGLMRSAMILAYSSSSRAGRESAPNAVNQDRAEIAAS